MQANFRWVTFLQYGLMAVFLNAVLARAAEDSEILAGFDQFWLTLETSEKPPDHTASDIRGTLAWSDNGELGSHWKITTPEAGSGDGTFGPEVEGATLERKPTSGGLRTINEQGEVFLDIKLRNRGTQSVPFSHLCFDAWRSHVGSGNRFVLKKMKDDLGDEMVIEEGEFTMQGTQPSPENRDYEDFAIALDSLPSQKLAPGQEIHFRLVIYDDDLEKISGLIIDNLALVHLWDKDSVD